MLQFQEYSIAWVIYVVASLGLAYMGWRVFRVISTSYIRRVLVLTVLVLFLTPASAIDQYWAPAWIITILQLLFEGVEGAEPAARILMVVWLFFLAVYSILSILMRITGLSKPASPTPPSSQKKANASSRQVKSGKGNRYNRIPPRVS